jgi:uncharacterized protein (DUF2267 family)
VAQLPSLLQSGLEQCLDGPDRNVTITAIEQELGSVLGLDAKGAGLALQAVCKAVAASVTAGELAEVRGQLPKEMRQLFPELPDRFGLTAIAAAVSSSRWSCR